MDLLLRDTSSYMGMYDSRYAYIHTYIYIYICVCVRVCRCRHLAESFRIFRNTTQDKPSSGMMETYGFWVLGTDPPFYRVAIHALLLLAEVCPSFPQPPVFVGAPVVHPGV